jgi:hypothetical protein
VCVCLFHLEFEVAGGSGDEKRDIIRVGGGWRDREREREMILELVMEVGMKSERHYASWWWKVGWKERMIPRCAFVRSQLEQIKCKKAFTTILLFHPQCYERFEVLFQDECHVKIASLVVVIFHCSPKGERIPLPTISYSQCPSGLSSSIPGAKSFLDHRVGSSS